MYFAAEAVYGDLLLGLGGKLYDSKQILASYTIPRRERN
jgi:hypothetical protein